MIKIEKLKIATQTQELVNIASLPIERSTLLVGQSGSGKSLTLKAILGLLPKTLTSSFAVAADFEIKRGKTISFVPQNPFTALSPLTKISKQFFAPKKRAQQLFEMLGLEWSLYEQYPPNLSGGQLQRVIFAIALANNPKLLLLDEPTTALDASLRDEFIEILKKTQKELGFYMLFVTHEIDLANILCDYMVVLKDGKVVESGGVGKILQNPQTLYTKELIESNFKNRKFRQ